MKRMIFRSPEPGEAGSGAPATTDTGWEPDEELNGQGGAGAPSQTATSSAPPPAAPAPPAGEPAKPSAPPAPPAGGPGAPVQPPVSGDTEKTNLMKGLGVASEEELKTLIDLGRKANNPFLKSLVDYASQEGADIARFLEVQKIEIDKIDTTGPEALIIQEMFQNGRTREEAEVVIKHRYKQTDDFSETEKTVGLIEQRDGIKKSIEWLKKFQEDSKITPQERDKAKVESDQAAAELIRRQGWEAQLPNIKASLAKIPLVAEDPDAKPDAKPEDSILAKYDLDVTGSAADQIAEYVKAGYENFTDDQGNPLRADNPDHVKWVNEFAQNRYFIENKGKILGRFAQFLFSQKEVDMYKRFHNAGYKSPTHEHGVPVSADSGEWQEDKERNN